VQPASPSWRSFPSFLVEILYLLNTNSLLSAIPSSWLTTTFCLYEFDCSKNLIISATQYLSFGNWLIMSLRLIHIVGYVWTSFVFKANSPLYVCTPFCLLYPPSVHTWVASSCWVFLFVFVVLGIKSGALHMLGKCSITELHSQPLLSFKSSL
jgi:hypothetical protein